jgi:hypothetical protein
MTTDSFTIRSIEALCHRYPLATLVVTSLGRDAQPSHRLHPRGR